MNRLESLCNEAGGKFRDHTNDPDIDEGIAICEIGDGEIITHEYDDVREVDIIRNDERVRTEGLDPSDLRLEAGSIVADNVDARIPGMYGSEEVYDATMRANSRGITFEETRSL